MCRTVQLPRDRLSAIVVCLVSLSPMVSNVEQSPLSDPYYQRTHRYWDLVERHKVTQFYTAPTAIRALMRFGPDIISNYDLSSLRVLGSVGEPINPEAWRWYYDNVRSYMPSYPFVSRSIFLSYIVCRCGYHDVPGKFRAIHGENHREHPLYEHCDSYR